MAEVEQCRDFKTQLTSVANMERGRVAVMFISGM